MELIQRYGLLAVFVSLVTTPIGNPIPEDISLFVAGVLAHMGSAHFATALIVGYLGVTLGDCIAYAHPPWAARQRLKVAADRGPVASTLNLRCSARYAMRTTR